MSSVLMGKKQALRVKQIAKCFVINYRHKIVLGGLLRRVTGTVECCHICVGGNMQEKQYRVPSTLLSFMKYFAI